MQTIKFYYEIANGMIEEEINKYLVEHPNQKITNISMTQDSNYTVCAIVYEGEN